MSLGYPQLVKNIVWVDTYSTVQSANLGTSPTSKEIIGVELPGPVLAIKSNKADKYLQAIQPNEMKALRFEACGDIITMPNDATTEVSKAYRDSSHAVTKKEVRIPTVLLLTPAGETAVRDFLKKVNSTYSLAL